MSSLTEIVLDTEYGYPAGKAGCESHWKPIVACAVEPTSGRQFRFWPEEGTRDLSDFVDRYRDALWIAHSAMAEMKFLLRMGIDPPKRWYDTLLAERWITNRSPSTPEVGLSKAMARYGLSGLASMDKSSIQDRLFRLDFDVHNESMRASIVEYCLQDCRACARLYAAQRRDPATREVLDKVMGWWPHYLLAVARMEVRGIPVDMDMFRAVQAYAPRIRERLAEAINIVAPVMGPSGVNRAAFVGLCRAQRIPLPTMRDPATGRRRISVADEAMKEIEAHHPFIAEVRQTTKTLKALRRNKLVVDAASGRHYFDTAVFRTVTGRNAPKRFIFGLAKWWRHMVVPEDRDHVLVYVDYTAQEIGIAAALSGDPAMRAMYAAEDPHMHFALQAGAVRNAGTAAGVRRKFKAVNLGVLYGQTPAGTARKLGIPQGEAERLHGLHARLYPTFWDWSSRVVADAYFRGEIRTHNYWRCMVPKDSSDRTWRNWPMQAAGADIMRITMMYFERSGLRTLAPLHDGFLLSCRRDKLEETHALIHQACEQAVAHVLRDFRLKWTVMVYPERFEDADGLPLWNRIIAIIKGIQRELPE